MSFFSSDRAVKYGWGLPRLALLTVAAFELAPRASSAVPAAHAAALSLAPYLASRRWAAHAYLGSVGAAVNVRVNSFGTNLVLLLLAAALCAWDARLDYSILVYLAKTFGGDFLAGKLDTAEWRLVLFFVFALFGPALWLLERDAPAAYAPYARIAPLLFLVQAVCEIGDNYCEQLVFFRHRYSFEVFTAALLFALAPTAAELTVIQHDLVICLFYRLSNFAIILDKSGVLWDLLRKGCFALFGWVRGTPLVNVTDAGVAMAVLRASEEKGAALERYVATPAWSPVLSLESVDGPLYKAMIADLHQVIALLPPPAALQVISARLCAELAAAGTLVDAEAVAQLSMAAVVEYLFGVTWQEDMQILVDASWEWRKEIAVRGKADAGIKAAAVTRVLALIRAHARLAPLFGERWAQPRYFSLILQPFLLSPCINVGDIAVTLKTQPALSLEEAIRFAHPFPIFERFVRQDIKHSDGSVAVKAGTQVIMFTADLKGAAWPVFGCGPRACAGTALAMALMRPVHGALRQLPAFQPARGHRYSGRNNDGAASLRETLYFLRVVAPVVLFANGKEEELPAC